jgi:hypothetical protein
MIAVCCLGWSQLSRHDSLPCCFHAVVLAGWLPLNDPLTRALLFVPLFTLLIVRLHRNTLAGSPGLTGVLNQPLLTYLVSLQTHSHCDWVHEEPAAPQKEHRTAVRCDTAVSLVSLHVSVLTQLERLFGAS